MGKWVYLIIGSIAGGISRYVLAGAVYEKLGTSFPYGTLVINLSGCFLIGFFSAIVDDKFFLGPNSRVLLMTGFCGAYTTFSTYMLETGNLVKDGEISRAFLNILVSTVIGFGAYWLGNIVGDII
jgi:CrcB protein